MVSSAKEDLTIPKTLRLARSIKLSTRVTARDVESFSTRQFPIGETETWRANISRRCVTATPSKNVRNCCDVYANKRKRVAASEEIRMAANKRVAGRGVVVECCQPPPSPLPFQLHIYANLIRGCGIKMWRGKERKPAESEIRLPRGNRVAGVFLLEKKKKKLIFIKLKLSGTSMLIHKNLAILFRCL